MQNSLLYFINFIKCLVVSDCPLSGYLSSKFIMPRMTDLDRARAIGQIEAGVPQRDVAQMFGVSKSTISKLKRKFQDTGYVKDRPRPGRPKSTTNDEDRFIRLNTLRDRRRSARGVQAMFARRYGRRPSVQTIRNRLHAANLHARRPAKRYSLSYLHRQARLRWSRLHLRWNQARWSSVMFSDESRFCLRFIDGRVRVWRRRGERFADSCVSAVTPFGGGSVMVWGGMSSAGKTNLPIIDGNLNAQRYRDEILQPIALPYLRNMGPNAVLQDDNARPHRARIIAEFLEEEGVDRMEWPANSPDLNPIEHLWDELGRAVRRRVTDQTTLADLRELLVEEWDVIPQQRVRTLVNSMRRRCQAVINAFGGYTRY